jgi:hypothetical protein
MAQGKSSGRDLDALTAEIALALADAALPMAKRIELERRFETIRLKSRELRSQ